MFKLLHHSNNIVEKKGKGKGIGKKMEKEKGKKRKDGRKIA